MVQGYNTATQLLTAQDVMELTGIGYANSLALVKAHGIVIGRKGYRITLDALKEALKHERRGTA